MDDNNTTNHAQLTPNGSVMHVLSSDDIEILDDGKTVRDFIDSKIEELGSASNEELFYVANLDSIVERHLRWISNLPRVKPFYAVKCNNTPAVIRMLSALDTGFDCASKAEIELVLSHGVTPNRIIYAHPAKPLSHIRYACTHGVDLMTFDSKDELVKISRHHAQAKLVLRIAVDDSESLVRLSSKFGARLVSVGGLLEHARKLELEVIGVSFHVGSGCTGSLAFKRAIADARNVFDVANSAGFQMSLLDIGGGFFAREDFHVKFEEFSDVINESLDKFFPPDSGVTIIAEPGRYYMESAFTLAVNVIAKRVDDMDEHCNDEENHPDRVMMYYINDGVYGSLNCLVNDPAHSSVEPYLHKAVVDSEPKYRSVIWGPTCNSFDKVSDGCWMPELQVGDWLLIDNMGAYSTCLTTDFNGFEKAHIYIVVSAKTWHAGNLFCT
ncbi:ornithine decarboxylase-like [Mugil cephalus]|uniref:ornithine decarboxylase-like n=1 Tax=Mugil cephalus TaxID=48193 RepID=UPI001FB67DF0|nr:ornithine decarboxylase-like [Mugil cephalus]